MDFYFVWSGFWVNPRRKLNFVLPLMLNVLLVHMLLLDLNKSLKLHLHVNYRCLFVADWGISSSRLSFGHQIPKIWSGNIVRSTWGMHREFVTCRFRLFLYMVSRMCISVSRSKNGVGYMLIWLLFFCINFCITYR